MASPDGERRAEKRDDGLWHSRVDVGEVSLHVAEARPAGDEVPADAPLVVMLHGFPELWFSWRHQLRALSEAGLWCVAPDMRGYAESDKPAGVAAYEVERLAGDVAGLVRALGRREAIVVGHDWGAVVAWHVAMLHPEIVRRLAILNVPHPVTMARGLLRPAQLARSWYIFFFQLPRLPERLVASRGFGAVRAMLERDGMPADEIAPYLDALRAPHALTSAIAYYRAAVRRVLRGSPAKIARIDCPVLVLWGDRDAYLGKELAAPPRRLVPHARVVHLPEASHWIQNVAPERVNELLLGFARE